VLLGYGVGLVPAHAPALEDSFYRLHLHLLHDVEVPSGEDFSAPARFVGNLPQPGVLVKAEGPLG